jgi:hypothetical protein
LILLCERSHFKRSSFTGMANEVPPSTEMSNEAPSTTPIFKNN